MATVDNRLFIVCDGMGGHAKGEVASQTVCAALSDYITNNVNLNEIFTVEMFEEALDYAYKQLDAKDTGDAKKMGTTLTFLLFHKGGCFMAHIGDSRIYHLRPENEQMLYISRDHSLVFDLFRSGEIKYEEMQTHPRKNIITRAMMPGEESRVNADVVNTTNIMPGDYFYLCSDGMVEQMDESDILGILGSENTDEAKQQRLISATLDNADNHSAYIIRVEDVEMDGDEDTYVNDEQTSRNNVINYIPELNRQEATKIGTGNFVSDNPAPTKDKKLFPWVKIVVVLIALAIIGLFIVPRYLKNSASDRYTKDKQGGVYQDQPTTEEEIYGQEERDSAARASKTTPESPENRRNAETSKPRPTNTNPQTRPVNDRPAPKPTGENVNVDRPAASTEGMNTTSRPSTSVNRPTTGNAENSNSGNSSGKVTTSSGMNRPQPAGGNEGRHNNSPAGSSGSGSSGLSSGNSGASNGGGNSGGNGGGNGGGNSDVQK